MINVATIRDLNISIDWVSLIVSCNLFHREAVCGKNEYLYTSVLANGTKRFPSYDDLFTIMGAGGGMSPVGTWIGTA